MTIDLLILGLILVFGVLGSLTGGASQIAQLAGMILAFLCARPLGRWLGPRFAAQLELPQSFGVICTTIIVFVVVLVAARVILTVMLRRLMAGKDPHDRSLDRSLGATLAAVKVAALAYVIVSGLAFAEEHVTVAGKRLGVSPRDSYAFRIAREYNLFEMTQFGAVHDLVAVARAVREGRTQELESNPAYKALRADPRFQRAVSDERMRRAIESGDYRTLLQNDAVLQLVHDRSVAARLDAVARDAAR